MTIGLIIARYNESIKWLNDMTIRFDQIYVYNKGSDSETDCLKDINNEIKTRITYKNLPNVGKEGHTYLWHMINNRDHLENDLIFTQANPFDHLIKKQCATVPFFESRISSFQKSDKDFEGFGAKHYLWCVGSGVKRDKVLQNLHEKMFKTEFNPEYRFNNGGIFAVERSNVLNRTPEFYNMLINTPMSTHINPHEGYALERLWVLIFNKQMITCL